MAQARENTDKKDEFRKNAENVGVTSITTVEARLQRVGRAAFAKNDPRFDGDEERDEFGKKKKKKFELAGNSDEAQLARSSGNYNIGETWEEYGSNPVTIRQEAQAQAIRDIAFQEEQSFFDSVYDYGYDLYEDTTDYVSGVANDIYDWGAEAYETASTAVSETVDSVVDTVSEAATAVKNGAVDLYNNGVALAKETGTAIADGFDKHIATPVANAWEATKEVASNAGTAITNAASSAVDTVSNAASSAVSSATTTISSGWSSLKNALGVSTPEQTQTADAQKPAVVQTLAKPEEKPAALVGDKNDVRLSKANSLSSAFGSAAEGSAQVADTAPAVAAPRLAPALTPSAAM